VAALAFIISCSDAEQRQADVVLTTADVLRRVNALTARLLHGAGTATGQQSDTRAVRVVAALQ
jgi:hypothetical protein